VARNFSCVDYSGEVVPQVACGFGPTYPGDFQYGQTSPQQHMYIQYGDGEVVTGPMGFSDITVGNITVSKQQVSLGNSTYWFGNNQTSGLMGLAFPSLTNAYLGTLEDHDPFNQIQYSPLFTSMVSQGRVAPVFSIAIDRNASSGMLAWGGIPPVIGVDAAQTATMDMIIVSGPETEWLDKGRRQVSLTDRETGLIDMPIASYDYSFYTIIPDGWEFDQTTNVKKYPYIVDSGTTLCYLPPSKFRGGRRDVPSYVGVRGTAKANRSCRGDQ